MGTKPKKKATRKPRKKGGWKTGDAGGGRPLLIDEEGHAELVEEVAPREFELLPLPDAPTPAAAAKRRKKPAAKRRT